MEKYISLDKLKINIAEICKWGEENAMSPSFYEALEQVEDVAEKQGYIEITFVEEAI